MTIQSRTYQGEADLRKLQAFTSEVIREAGQCGMLHPGDVPHRIYNFLRHENPSELACLWEDEHGRLLAWSLVYPRTKALDFFLRPECRDSPLATQTLETAEIILREILARRQTVGELLTDVWDCDQKRIGLLEAQGWQREHQVAYRYTTRSLALPIPPLRLPEGFTIRSAKGAQETEQLAAVHRGSFNSAWTGETYRQVTISPGYDAERELVVVAPDGRFAAFCVIWFDAINKIGLFEPVGTHSDFRRMGLATQLMCEAMRRMKAAGMETACVTWESNNNASQGLYTSLGFKPRYDIYLCKK